MNDDFPANATEIEIDRIAPDLGVTREPGESFESYRARVVAAWDALDNPAPRPAVLGGFTLG